MDCPWNTHGVYTMGIPWTSHGDFIWAKTHGKLMEYFHDISMGHFYKGKHVPRHVVVSYS